jgi:peptidoglycan/xylan/chitin deacetylase (PgdA/CDA1 family)
MRLIANSAWRSRRLLILCYHGVSLDREHEWLDLYVSRDHLESRLRLLRQQDWNILHLKDGVEQLYSGTLPPRSVAITFDDGLYDFYVNALPLLREYRVPATLYLSTWYCTYQRPVFDPVISYMLWLGRGRTLDLSGILVNGGTELVPHDDAARSLLQRRFLVDAAGWSGSQKDAIAQLVAQRLGIDYQEILQRRILHLMTGSELRSLDADLVDVQLHTHRHRTPRNEVLFRKEIDDNRQAIEHLRGRYEPLEHFCYPSGDYADEFLPWLREAGVRSATTCDPDLATSETDPMLLPRFVDTMNVSELFF